MHHHFSIRRAQLPLRRGVAVLGKAYLQDRFFEEHFLPASSPTPYLSGGANRTGEQLRGISVLNQQGSNYRITAVSGLKE